MNTTRYSAGDGTIPRARKLRKDSTPAEQKLWSIVRNSNFAGAKFRRQQRLGPYYADLICQSQRLIIEIDGDTHASSVVHDAKRTAYLTHEGYRVLRFTNTEVTNNSEGVATAILTALEPSPSH